MKIEFHSQRDPSIDFCKQVANLAPTNPFYTPSYIETRRRLVSQPWVLSLRKNGELIAACSAFTKSGYLNRSLEITSLPTFPENHGFWDGLLTFCRKIRVSQLVVGSFASTSTAIPELPGQVRRTSRREYVLHLQGDHVLERLSSHHTRNIKRAFKAGLKVQRAVDEEACHDHARLIHGSMERRKVRGESVPEDIQTDTFVAMMRSGAGEIFRAVLENKVLSSVLVLKAEKGGYYQSAGTSPDGMASGASHFLVHEIASTLRAQGMYLFNLGGVDQTHPGLERFKAGFGASPVELESVEFFLGSVVERKLATAARLLRNLARFAPASGLGQ